MSEHDDDRDWLALLAGQPAPHASPETRREAQALRQAILNEYAASSQAEPDAAALQRLLFRLRQEELITPHTPLWRRPQVWSLAVVAATLLVMLPWAVWRAPEPPVVYKSFHMPQVLYTLHPQEQATTLQQELAALGVTTQYLAQDDSHFVLARMAMPPTTAVRALLQRYGLTIPSDGHLRIEILRSGE